MSSVFSLMPRRSWVAHNKLAFAVRDSFPVSPGHTLVVPFREVATWFDASEEEQRAILELVAVVKDHLQAELRPDGYNVGFNAGRAAGQTVMHLHVHVIPRFEGDVPDPRGGVRHVIPGRGNYLAQVSPSVAFGGTHDPFLRHLLPLFDVATSASIVAAFVQDSGLVLLHQAVHEMLARGGRVRLITGDYLAITQVAALERLLTWSVLSTRSPIDAGSDPLAEAPGCFEVRIVETERLSPPGTSFHPKCWMFEGPGGAVGFVGSSNISRSALGSGIEWNLRTERASSPAAWASISVAFDDLWKTATPLSSDWLAGYEKRARLASRPFPPGEEETEPPTPVPQPHELQMEGLDALKRSRADGRRRALVVMATGLGKTWLAAFDLAQMRDELGRFPRTLFVAHRAEILEQAAATLGQIARLEDEPPRVSWYAGSSDDLSGDLVFASVLKLARKEGLERLATERFDYVIVDEVHHATAATYQRILDRVDTAFLLGLTATPGRADEADVCGLFDDHVPFNVDLGEGIRRGLLSPFEYTGLKDTVDYSNIPWRNRRFDMELLAQAAATEARMTRLWEAWQAHGGTRTLVFCCSVAHAAFTQSWLSDKGVRCRSVTADTPAVERAAALQDLREGALDALCSVDLFNEGIDVPAVDRVVMLRPTESPVLFLQQLGRGLRQAGGKSCLTVLDFVGNHRFFLDRLRLLLSFSQRPDPLRTFLTTGTAEELPPGCSVDVELEAIEMLRFLLPKGENEVIRAYRELKLMRGIRPSAGELFRMSYLPSRLGGWFGFVEREGDLTREETAALAGGRDWFEDIETTRMEKSFKMVVLEVLLEADALRTGLPLEDVAARSHAYIARSPELLCDITGVARFDDPVHPDAGAWLSYWRENPIRAWTEGAHGKWFQVQGDRLVPRLKIAEGALEAFADMTRELVDYRLAQYRKRAALAGDRQAFTCKVLWNQRDPILKLPPRTERPDVPSGEADVRLPDGAVWQFRFAKEFCNVARPAGKDRNELADLLRSWFGPSAGKPGTAFGVRFSPSPDGLWIEPSGEAATDTLSGASRVPCYPSLRAAAGAALQDSLEDFEHRDEVGASEVRLPIAKPGARLFAVRASGSSMDGGRDAIRDGDWVVMRWARGEALKSLLHKIALIETSDMSGESAYQLKRIEREEGRWLLRSDNPAVGDFEASERSLPIAVHVQTVRPEELGPAVGTVIAAESLAQSFGVDIEPRTGRTDGHLFVFVETPGTFASPDRLDVRVDRLPGETAFVLARNAPEAPWRFCGVGRWLDAEGVWQVPELDWATWHALGRGRSAARRLPDDLRSEAEGVVARILAAGALVTTNDGERFLRVVGRAAEGGIRIDGGPDGFGERTISLIDIGWVLAAERDARLNGGLADEARVNRLRYLEGTPKGSTRWVDTKHAIRLLTDFRARARSEKGGS